MNLTISSPFDAHVHFRDGDMMRAVVPFTARDCGRALVMPNVPAIENVRQAREYHWKIRNSIDSTFPNFLPLMTIKLTQQTTPKNIYATDTCGYVIAAKLYPTGATTGSHDGVSDPVALFPVFEAMQSSGMVLCIHGEKPSSFVLDRESHYLPTVRNIIRNFPGLKVVLEHITTKDAVDFVREASVNVAATITAHHLCRTLDDVIGGLLKPHEFCKPIPKRPEDRFALLRAALRDESGRIFFGSDSAPHARGAKESPCGCAGVFSAPVALPTLTEIFVRSACVNWNDRPCDDQAWENARSRLERFVSVSGAKFYGLPPAEGTVTLTDESPWTVPEEIGGVVPWRAGETIPWSVVRL